mmetsp:Transcript_78458/g.139109  ORF Transcript_78458/g.139109 Transcript_78458/m.139109 type:complete len:306 (-) Transcript_78458:94-1011(-)
MIRTCTCFALAIAISSVDQRDYQGDADRVSFLQGKVQTGHSMPAVLNSTTATAAESLMSLAYYINLDRSTDRRKYMERQLFQLQQASENSYGHFVFHRFPAVNGTLDPYVQKIWQDSDNGKQFGGTVTTVFENRRLGSLACTRSHLLVLKRALRDVQSQAYRGRYVLIMEDDANFVVDSLASLPSRVDAVPKDADLVMLGTFGLKRQRDYVGSGVYRARKPFARKASDVEALAGNYDKRHPNVFYGGMQAYLVPVARLPAVIDFLETTPPATEIDALTHNLQKYVLDPPLARQKPGKSEVAHAET